MDAKPTESSRFESLLRIACGASLAASVLTSWSLFGSIGDGLYGGTALFIAFILFAQVTILLLLVAFPCIVLFFCHRLRISRLGWSLAALAVFFVVADAVALAIIPVTGNC